MKDEQLKLLHQAFEQHELRDTERFDEIKQKLDTLLTSLQPISETYTTASNMMRWFMALLVAISIMVGIVWGIIQIILRIRA